MTAPVQYPNVWSRLLLQRAFSRQFIIPEKPHPVLERFLKWYERTVMDVDLRAIFIDRPIFLIGLPRSGTSMLQDILCTHPQVAYITNTMHQFRSCFAAAEALRKQFQLDAKGDRYLEDSIVVDSGSPNDAVAFWGEWLRDDPYSLTYVERKLEHFTPGEIDEIRRDVRKIIWCHGDTSRRFFSKNPGLLSHILLLKGIFPDAHFIHIVRDARMVANSMVKLYRKEQQQLARIKAQRSHGLFDQRPFVPYPRLPGLAGYVAEFGVDSVRTTAHLWSEEVRHVQACRPQLGAFTEVRYEDILANPREQILRIFDFCGLSLQDAQNEKFNQKVGEVGHLRHTNQYGEFDVIEAICRPEMQQYGYL